jgi:hypothetical protein
VSGEARLVQDAPSNVAIWLADAARQNVLDAHDRYWTQLTTAPQSVHDVPSNVNALPCASPAAQNVAETHDRADGVPCTWLIVAVGCQPLDGVPPTYASMSTTSWTGPLEPLCSTIVPSPLTGAMTRLGTVCPRSKFRLDVDGGAVPSA